MIFIAVTSMHYKNTSVVEDLVSAGIDVLRFNLAYGTVEENIEKINIAREVIKKSGKEVKIMADLPGNKIRIGKLAVSPVQIKKGQELSFSGIGGETSDVPVLLSNIEKYVYPGCIIIYKDGEIVFRVTEVQKNRFKAVASNDYELYSNKSLSFHGAIDDLDHLTDKTIEQIDVIDKTQPEFVSFSFVRDREAMEKNKKALYKVIGDTYKPIIVGKIESEFGVKNIDEIVDECDWVMIARGDLALNVPFSKLGVCQKLITKRVKLAGKKVIVATQILESMRSNYIPFRGDILDLTNIVLDGNDGIMFSCTGSVDNPGEIVKMAKEIVHQVERT